MNKGKTIRVKVEDFSRYLRDHRLTIEASAGPKANITGMRKLYWGKEATIIKSGQYIYKVH